MTAKSQARTEGYYRELTDKLVAQLENNPGTWSKSWSVSAASGLPSNAVTGKPYSGANVLYLLIAGQEAGYSSNRWATYRQWATIDGQVRKGEKAEIGVYWNFVEKEDKATGKIRKIGFMRTFSLFNLDQVEGDFGDRFEVVERTPAERDAEAEEFFGQTGVVIRKGSPAYNRTRDVVTMPDAEDFDCIASYYGTLAHESGHWTGHQDRLDRTFGKRFGDDAYAFEELVAELSAVFTCAHLGIEVEPREDHAQYIASWVRTLRADVKAVYTASSQAAKATNFLIEASEAGAVSEEEVAA